MLYVTQAKYLKNYKIQLTFNDQKSGIVDLEFLVKNDHRQIAKELSNPDLFKNFHVEMDTIVWANGFDLAPEFLYSQIKPLR